MSDPIAITPEEAANIAAAIIAKEELRKKKRAYMAVFNTSAGEEVLKDLAIRCCIHFPSFQLCYQPNLAERTIYNEGARSTYLHINTMLSSEGMEDDKVVEPKKEA